VGSRGRCSAGVRCASRARVLAAARSRKGKGAGVGGAHQLVRGGVGVLGAAAVLAS
jgi:hypothetical protein